MSDGVELQEEETEADVIEQLREELTTLQSDVVFSAFVNVGLRYIGFEKTDEGLVLNYDKTKHLAVFQALSESYDEFAESQAKAENG